VVSKVILEVLDAVNKHFAKKFKENAKIIKNNFKNYKNVKKRDRDKKRKKTFYT